MDQTKNDLKEMCSFRFSKCNLCNPSEIEYRRLAMKEYTFDIFIAKIERIYVTICDLNRFNFKTD